MISVILYLEKCWRKMLDKNKDLHIIHCKVHVALKYKAYSFFNMQYHDIGEVLLNL